MTETKMVDMSAEALTTTLDPPLVEYLALKLMFVTSGLLNCDRK